MNDEELDILIANAEYEPEQLKDYITNLKHENEKWWVIIKDNEQEIKDLCLENSKLEDELEDYKSRCEKAVEYIQNHQLVFELSSKKVISQWFDMFYKDILNILNGRSDG